MAEVIRLEGLDGAYDMLRSLPAEVVSKRGGVVKTALLKGARVLLREAALNLARATGRLSAEGDDTSTGFLLRNLVATRGKAPKVGKGERYLVRVRRKPYVRKGKPVTTLKTAQLLEYGSSQQQAEPWLRTAFQSKARAAIETIERETVAGVERAAQKALRAR